MQFDGPLNRLAERNAYRASLITYQRAKRAYVALSDRIEFADPPGPAQLTRLRASFEIARQQLLSAARQFENARLTLFGPRQQARRAANDATTLNLLQALSNLLDARNALVGSYISFEQQRVQLLLDLEALQLDQRGFPTNVPARTPDRPPADGPTRRPERLPAARPCALPPLAAPSARSVRRTGPAGAPLRRARRRCWAGWCTPASLGLARPQGRRRHHRHRHPRRPGHHRHRPRRTGERRSPCR